jgi:hypothetical protein
MSILEPEVWGEIYVKRPGGGGKVNVLLISCSPSLAENVEVTEKVMAQFSSEQRPLFSLCTLAHRYDK